MIPKRPIPRHIIIKLSKVKDKDRILKTAREKKVVVYREPQKIISRLLSRNFAGP